MTVPRPSNPQVRESLAPTFFLETLGLVLVLVYRGFYCAFLSIPSNVVNQHINAHVSFSGVRVGTITVSSSTSRGAVISGMVDPATHTILIASSRTPYGSAIAFYVASRHANTSWLLCDLSTGAVSKPASPSGVVEWGNQAEYGSVLLFGAHTPCHSRTSQSTAVRRT